MSQNNLISFITGASGGFGRAICQAISLKNNFPSTFVITGRNETELEETSRLIKQINTNNKVIKKIYDLSSKDSLKFNSFINELYEYIQTDQYTSVDFYHNAATLGPLSYIGTELEKPWDQIYDEEFYVNCTTCFTLTSVLINKIYSSHFPSVTNYNIINISSLAGIQPFDSWSNYCSHKAAREMFFKTLVLEIEKRNNSIKKLNGVVPSIFVLNYAPGPLDTNMQKTIREDKYCDKEISSYYNSLFVEGKLIQPLDSAKKLISILDRKQSFESGAHIDYYDEI